MDMDEIPELEHYPGVFGSIHSTGRPDINTIANHVEKASETELNEDTRIAFRKALQNKSNSWKSCLSPDFVGSSEVRKSNLEDKDTPNWITDGLLAKIQSNPSVSAWLQNPRKVSFLNELQKNPNKLFNQKNTKEDACAIQKIAEILGEHFEDLAIQREKEVKVKPPVQSHKPLIEEVLSPEEKELQTAVDRMLANEEIRCALQDEHVREIIETLRCNPEKGQMLARQASSSVKEKLNLLIRNGILAVE
ncbi:conserved hypothetical protein [Echinococcus multilocularis]|uniref:STI1/HOP DP domain-containing protein n=1 Tax=Echinococcus multilocularis TaxID=6211 RepID=A0A068Y4I7_ECHMU|nr:conserved hypothetical protein [Echinococcus multilocularis]